jgi:hypothetical protein
MNRFVGVVLCVWAIVSVLAIVLIGPSGCGSG